MRNRFRNGMAIAATALLMAAGGMAGPALAQSSMTEAGALPDTTLERPAFESQMQTYIDRTNDSIEELRTGSSNVTEDQLAEMQSSWSTVQQQWDESRNANDTDWATSRDTLSRSVTDFDSQYGGMLGGPQGNSTLGTTGSGTGSSSGDLSQ